jgi:hypothetical protein
VLDNVIFKVLKEQEGIKQRTTLLSNASCETSFCTTVGPIKDALYQWIDGQRHAKLTIPPSIAIEKDREIAISWGFIKDEFKSL